MKIAKQVQLLRDVRNLFGNNIDCDSTMKRIIGQKFECPKCHGSGIIHEKYNAYPSNLPDSGWGELWRYRDKECDLCNGEGYTDHEYKPKMVQDGWV